MTKMTDVHYLSRTHDTASYRIAYRQRNPVGQADGTGGQHRPGVLWLGGFKSDMDGSKAEKLDAWAAATGRSFTRFDYFAHGLSQGDFVDGTLSHWYEDAYAVLAHVTQGPQILVGSSMGGWIACLLAHRLATQPPQSPRPPSATKVSDDADLRPGTPKAPKNQKNQKNPGTPGTPETGGRTPGPLAGLVLIAPALDFTELLMWEMMSDHVQRTLMTTGRYEKPSDYSGEPYLITKALIEDGRHHLLLNEPIKTNCPVHILQGQQDTDVPWQHALRIAEQIAQDDVILTFVKTGDHRLSAPADLTRMIDAIEAIA